MSPGASPAGAGLSVELDVGFRRRKIPFRGRFSAGADDISGASTDGRRADEKGAASSLAACVTSGAAPETEALGSGTHAPAGTRGVCSNIASASVGGATIAGSTRRGGSGRAMVDGSSGVGGCRGCRAPTINDVEAKSGCARGLNR